MAGIMPVGWALPALNDFNRPFFTTGKIVLQECSACGTVQHPPEEVCHRCLGMAFGVRETSGKGTIYSFIVVHHPVAPALKDAVPYAVVLVSLDDVPAARVLGNVVNRPPGEIAIGQRVRAVFQQVEDAVAGVTLQFPEWEVMD
jgi:uncharacterized protein